MIGKNKIPFFRIVLCTRMERHQLNFIFAMKTVKNFVVFNVVLTFGMAAVPILLLLGSGYVESSLAFKNTSYKAYQQ